MKPNKNVQNCANEEEKKRRTKQFLLTKTHLLHRAVLNKIQVNRSTLMKKKLQNK